MIIERFPNLGVTIINTLSFNVHTSMTCVKLYDITHTQRIRKCVQWRSQADFSLNGVCKMDYGNIVLFKKLQSNISKIVLLVSSSIRRNSRHADSYWATLAANHSSDYTQDCTADSHHFYKLIDLRHVTSCVLLLLLLVLLVLSRKQKLIQIIIDIYITVIHSSLWYISNFGGYLFIAAFISNFPLHPAVTLAVIISVPLLL